MQTQLKDLLDEIKEYQDDDNLDFELLDKKVKGELLPQSTVKVYFKGRENPDIGYAFLLPHQHADEMDICIHIPSMDNSDGMDKGEEIFKHIYSIAKLENVIKIVSNGGMIV